jgi:phosphohistidine phosphatase
VLTLYLMRHATAAGSGPDGTDHTRLLTPKGRQEAEAIGKFLRRTGVVLDAAACSSAARAHSTADLVLRAWGSKLKPQAVPDLYNASGAALLRWIQGRPAAQTRLLVVAHMPGVAELISLLTTEATDLAMGFSPATLAAVESEAELWADWDYGRGSLQFVVPAAVAGGKVPAARK